MSIRRREVGINAAAQTLRDGAETRANGFENQAHAPARRDIARLGVARGANHGLVGRVDRVSGRITPHGSG